MRERGRVGEGEDVDKIIRDVTVQQSNPSIGECSRTSQLDTSALRLQIWPRRVCSPAVRLMC